MKTASALVTGAALVGLLTQFTAYFTIEMAVALLGAAIVALCWPAKLARYVALGATLLMLAGEAGGMTAALLGAAGALGAASAMVLRARGSSAPAAMV